MGANVVMTLFLSVSLKAMWNMVHVLQVIIFLPELLDYPPNAKLFIDSVNEAIELEEITNQFMETVIPPSVMQLPSEKEELEKYIKGNIILSMGLFFVVLAGLFILLVIFCIMQAFRRRIANCCTFVYRKLEATLFYNSLIRYMIEGNLKLTFTHIFILAEESS